MVDIPDLFSQDYSKQCRSEGLVASAKASFTQREKIRMCLLLHGPMTAPELAETLNMRLTSVHGRLNDLMAPRPRPLVKEAGTKKNPITQVNNTLWKCIED